MRQDSRGVKTNQADCMMSDNLCNSFPKLCKAARALLGWSQEDLANASSVSRSTIADFEREVRAPIPNNILAMRNALEKAGIVFHSDAKSIGAYLKVAKVKGR